MRQEKLKVKSNEFLNKEKEGLAKWRENLKKDPDHYGKFKEDDKLRKWAAEKRKEVPEAGNSEGYTRFKRMRKHQALHSPVNKHYIGVFRELISCFKFWLVRFFRKNISCGVITNATMGKVPWLVLVLVEQ